MIMTFLFTSRLIQWRLESASSLGLEFFVRGDGIVCLLGS